ncbi:hypothetical protein G7046_g4779 [Stylonectria norvegica]|nr:hypothetical protein G7046_g4779 [Stylonectria norvegica]
MHVGGLVVGISPFDAQQATQDACDDQSDTGPSCWLSSCPAFVIVSAAIRHDLTTDKGFNVSFPAPFGPVSRVRVRVRVLAVRRPDAHPHSVLGSDAACGRSAALVPLCSDPLLASSSFDGRVGSSKNKVSGGCLGSERRDASAQRLSSRWWQQPSYQRPLDVSRRNSATCGPHPANHDATDRFGWVFLGFVRAEALGQGKQMVLATTIGPHTLINRNSNSNGWIHHPGPCERKAVVVFSFSTCPALRLDLKSRRPCCRVSVTAVACLPAGSCKRCNNAVFASSAIINGLIGRNSAVSHLLRDAQVRHSSMYHNENQPCYSSRQGSGSLLPIIDGKSRCKEKGTASHRLRTRRWALVERQTFSAVCGSHSVRRNGIMDLVTCSVAGLCTQEHVLPRGSQGGQHSKCGVPDDRVLVQGVPCQYWMLHNKELLTVARKHGLVGASSIFWPSMRCDAHGHQPLEWDPGPWRAVQAQSPNVLPSVDNANANANVRLDREQYGVELSSSARLGELSRIGGTAPADIDATARLADPIVQPRNLLIDDGSSVRGSGLRREPGGIACRELQLSQPLAVGCVCLGFGVAKLAGETTRRSGRSNVRGPDRYHEPCCIDSSTRETRGRPGGEGVQQCMEVARPADMASSSLTMMVPGEYTTAKSLEAGLVVMRRWPSTWKASSTYVETLPDMSQAHSPPSGTIELDHVDSTADQDDAVRLHSQSRTARLRVRSLTPPDDDVTRINAPEPFLEAEPDCGCSPQSCSEGDGS